MNLRYMLMNEVGLLAAGRIANMKPLSIPRADGWECGGQCVHFNEEMD